MVNKEIFVMLTFFVGVVSFLGLVIGTGITVTNNSNVVVANGNQSILQQSGLQSAGYTCNASSISQTGNNLFSGIPILSFVNQVGNFIYGNIFAAINAVGNFIFPTNHIVTAITTPNNLGNCLTNTQAQSSGFDIVATATTPSTNLKSNSIDQIVAQTIVVGVAFVGLGLLAGALGAGSLANIVVSVGIGISLIFFMQSVLGSSYFAGTPFIIEIFIDGITGVFFIWIVMTLLRD